MNDALCPCVRGFIRDPVRVNLTRLCCLVLWESLAWACALLPSRGFRHSDLCGSMQLNAEKNDCSLGDVDVVECTKWRRHGML